MNLFTKVFVTEQLLCGFKMKKVDITARVKIYQRIITQTNEKYSFALINNS